MKYSISVLLLSIYTISSWAQLPYYGDGMIYRIESNVISNYNPNLPASPTNPVNNTASLAFTFTPSGLAVGENMFSNDGTYTFYVANSQTNTYFYYDLTTNSWVNTGHSYGASSAVNPGMGGGIMYSLVGGSGQIWKYDFTGPATLLTTITDFNGGGPYDVVADCVGNFYLLKTSVSGSGQWMRQYDPNGNLLHEWSLVGANSATAGGGFAIVADTVYWHNGGNLTTALLNANTVDVINIQSFPQSSDYANIPIGAGPVVGFSDSLFVCQAGSINVVPSSTDNLSWTVSNNNASVTQNSDLNLTVDFIGSFSLYLDAFSACSQDNTIKDTLEVFLIEHQVSLADTIEINGCGTYSTMISSGITTLPSFIDKDLVWTTSHGVVTSGQGSNQIEVQMYESGYVYLSINTAPHHGGCIYKDSIYVLVTDYSIDTDFEYEVIQECNYATLQLNSSVSTLHFPSITHNYLWDFGNGLTSSQYPYVDNDYYESGYYYVSLNIENQYCNKSETKIIYINFPTSDTSTYTELVCAADMPFSFYGHVYEDYGTYESVLKNVDNCDSVVNLRLFEADTYNITIEESICPGTEFIFGGNILTQPGIYTEEFISKYGCDSVVTLYLNVNDFTLKLDSYPNPSYEGELVTFQLTGNQYFDVDSWTPIQYFPYQNRTLQKVIFENEGVYTIEVNGTSDIGCESSVSKTIQVLPIDPSVLLPSAFTPNGDGLNDFFSPKFLIERGYVLEEFSIYNRFGQRIFEGSGSTNIEWDGSYMGEPCEMGVYIYVIKVTFSNGVTKQFKGDISLIR